MYFDLGVKVFLKLPHIYMFNKLAPVSFITSLPYQEVVYNQVLGGIRIRSFVSARIYNTRKSTFSTKKNLFIFSMAPIGFTNHQYTLRRKFLKLHLHIKDQNTIQI